MCETYRGYTSCWVNCNRTPAVDIPIVAKKGSAASIPGLWAGDFPLRPAHPRKLKILTPSSVSGTRSPARPECGGIIASTFPASLSGVVLPCSYRTGMQTAPSRSSRAITSFRGTTYRPSLYQTGSVSARRDPRGRVTANLTLYQPQLCSSE
jgi:hypothetical protein